MGDVLDNFAALGVRKLLNGMADASSFSHFAVEQQAELFTSL